MIRKMVWKIVLKSQEEETPREEIFSPVSENEAPTIMADPEETILKETMPESIPLSTEDPHFFREQPQDTVWMTDSTVLFVTLQQSVMPEKVEWQSQAPDGSWNPVTDGGKLVAVTDGIGKYVLRVMDASFTDVCFRCAITVEGRTQTSEEARVLPPSGDIAGIEW